MSVLSVWVACMLCLKCWCDCQSDVCIHCVVFHGVEFCVCEIVSTDAAVAFHRDTRFIAIQSDERDSITSKRITAEHR